MGSEPRITSAVTVASTFNVAGFLLLLLFSVCSGLGAEEFSAHRIYPHLLDPREHPDYARRAVKPPSWDTFGNVTHFASLRGLPEAEGRLVDYAEEIEKYVNTFSLGDVIWPAYPVIFTSNLGDLADEIKRRNAFLFDIWGYVPGSGPGGYWQQFKPPAGVF
ncbi:MAG: hypothetical protein HYZ00_08485 [Candidatus Hydrogenedentes bacterium]|nr:hypothetical protein [Candidatus Hydrogenedentota bacterium]